MLSIPLPGLRPALVLLAILAGPAPAAVASHTTGYGGYGGGCNSKYTGYSGYGYLSPCFAERPRPWISIDPPHPGAGQVITLSAENVREGSVAEWDTDNDGAFDDPETVSYPAGKKTVRVKVTDPDGRIGFATRSINVHAGNLVPKVSITASQSAPRVGQQIDLRVTATDLDGQITAVALDLDDNGSFETPYPEGGPVTTSFATAGSKRIRARATDSSGATAIAAIQVDVHTANRNPVVAIYASNTGGVRANQPVTLSTSAYDNDGTIASVAFDRDGNGTYETVPAGGARSTTVTFTTTGRKRVGVRATDDGGATAEADIELRVSADNDPPTAWLSQMWGNSRMFSVSSYDSDGIAEYAWDLDDDGVFDDLVGPGASTALIPGTISGTVHVGVRVTDKLGAAITRRQSFHVGIDKIDGPTLFGNMFVRADTDTWLSAIAGAPNATLDWDLDDDGAFDDATGTSIGPKRFSAGNPKIAVRQTSGTDVRIARTRLTVSPAIGDWAPYAAITTSPSRVVRTGVPVSLSGWVNWSTFTTWSYAWDLDEDGAYDDATGATTQITPTVAGDHDVAVKATSTTPPATVEQTLTLSVHTQNRPPLPTITSLPVPPQTGDLRIDPGTALQFGVFNASPDDATASTDWDLDGDGAFDDSTSSSPSKTFTTLGTFRVRVRVTDAGGATGMDTLNVRVTTPPPNRAPVVSLSGGQRVPVGSPAHVNAYASDPEGGAITYAWDLDEDGAFDDGTGTSASPTFTTPGTHRVRVRATDPAGATDTALLTIASYPASDVDPPSLSFATPNLIRAGKPARIYASAYAQDGSATTITFDLDGDGQFDDVPAAGAPFSYTSLWTFPTAGPKTVSAKAVDGAGRTRTVTRTLNVTGANLGPEVFITSYQSVVAGRPTWFSASGIDLDDDDASIDWYYSGSCVLDWDLDGDGAYDDRHTETTTWGCGDAASVTFPTVNEEHTVGVRMTDDDGATAFHRTTFRVASDAPSAAFSVSPTTVNPGQPVTLTSAAWDDDGAIVERLWDLDDDGAFDDAGGPNTTVTFSELGVHLVGHKVRDGDGDIGIVYHPVSVVPVGPPPPPPDTGGESSGGGGGQPGAGATGGGGGTSGGAGGSAGGGSADTVKPKLTLVAPAKSALKLSRLGRGLPFRLTCSEPCRLTATATVTSAVRKQAKLKSTTVGRLSRTLRPGAPVTVAIKLDPKAVRALKRLRSVTLTLTFVVTDNAQNRTTRTQRVTLRR